MAYTEQGPTALPDGGPPALSEAEGMDDEGFASAVKQALDDAVDYIDGYVATSRAKATAYYRGDLFGNGRRRRFGAGAPRLRGDHHAACSRVSNTCLRSTPQR